MQRALLQILLDAHPMPLSIEEVRDRFGDDRDAAGRAIDQLVDHGVARRGKLFVLASRTAVHTARLL